MLALDIKLYNNSASNANPSSNTHSGQFSLTNIINFSYCCSVNGSSPPAHTCLCNISAGNKNGTTDGKPLISVYKPQNAFLNESSFNSELTVGSFGLVKSVINANYGTSKNSFRAVFSDTKSDGYRENNNYNRQTITLNTNHFISKKDEVSFLVSFVDLKAFIPSSINENTFINNPESAAFTWKQAQGYEDAQHGIFGISWNHDYSSSLKQVTSIFTSFRDAYEPRPFDILKENTHAIGIRSRVLGNDLLFKNSFK